MSDIKGSRAIKEAYAGDWSAFPEALRYASRTGKRQHLVDLRDRVADEWIGPYEYLMDPDDMEHGFIQALEAAARVTFLHPSLLVLGPDADRSFVRGAAGYLYLNDADFDDVWLEDFISTFYGLSPEWDPFVSDALFSAPSGTYGDAEQMAHWLTGFGPWRGYHLPSEVWADLLQIAVAFNTDVSDLSYEGWYKRLSDIEVGDQRIGIDVFWDDSDPLNSEWMVQELVDGSFGEIYPLSQHDSLLALWDDIVWNYTP